MTEFASIDVGGLVARLKQRLHSPAHHPMPLCAVHRACLAGTRSCAQGGVYTDPWPLRLHNDKTVSCVKRCVVSAPPMNRQVVRQRRWVARGRSMWTTSVCGQQGRRLGNTVTLT